MTHRKRPFRETIDDRQTPDSASTCCFLHCRAEGQIVLRCLHVSDSLQGTPSVLLLLNEPLNRRS
jgi:hypothetical protein